MFVVLRLKALIVQSYYLLLSQFGRALHQFIHVHPHLSRACSSSAYSMKATLRPLISRACPASTWMTINTHVYFKIEQPGIGQLSVWLCMRRIQSGWGSVRLLEARILSEEHCQHDLVDLRQVYFPVATAAAFWISEDFGAPQERAMEFHLIKQCRARRFSKLLETLSASQSAFASTTSNLFGPEAMKKHRLGTALRPSTVRPKFSASAGKFSTNSTLED